MSRKYRILVTDDELRWRNVLSRTLERGDYHVDVAGSMKETLEKIEQSLYHLIVLDIRMEETDPDDAGGMDLLDELHRLGLGQAIKILMLSAHGTREQMRMAFRDFYVVDFLSKEDFDNREFLNQVRSIFQSDFKLNPNLTVHWQGVSGPEEQIIGLGIGPGSRIKRSSPDELKERYAMELDDLLCRLFHEADSILVRPLVAGASGAGVLWTQPFYAAGGAQAVVVKYGDASKIEMEQRNFETYVQPYVGGGRCTAKLDYRRTPKLGGLVYSLLGTAGDQVADFGTFYKTADIDQIKHVLDQLFWQTCGAWYANPGRLQPHDLAEDYRDLLKLRPEKLERDRSDALKAVQGTKQLRFTNLSGDRSFSNPIPLADQHQVRSTYIATTHGDFNEQNILVDSAGQTWLIDFLRTGTGHILRDVAQLDSVVRFKLLLPEEATLDERLEMEEALNQCDRFSQVERLAGKFPTENEALAKAYATAVHLRTIAQRMVAQNPSDDISEYYIALLFYSLNLISFYRVPKEQREHALLSASLLADQLGLGG